MLFVSLVVVCGTFAVCRWLEFDNELVIKIFLVFK